MRVAGKGKARQACGWSPAMCDSAQIFRFSLFLLLYLVIACFLVLYATISSLHEMPYF